MVGRGGVGGGCQRESEGEDDDDLVVVVSSGSTTHPQQLDADEDGEGAGDGGGNENTGSDSQVPERLSLRARLAQRNPSLFLDDDDDDDDDEGGMTMTTPPRPRTGALQLDLDTSPQPSRPAMADAISGGKGTAASGGSKARRARQRMKKAGTAAWKSSMAFADGSDTDLDDSSIDGGDEQYNDIGAPGAGGGSYCAGGSEGSYTTGTKQRARAAGKSSRQALAQTQPKTRKESTTKKGEEAMSKREQQAAKKEQRRRAQEERKRQKEHSKAVQKLVRTTSKKKDPAAHLATMTCFISSQMTKARAYEELRTLLASSDVAMSIVDDGDASSTGATSSDSGIDPYTGLAGLGRTMWWRRRCDSVDKGRAALISTYQYEPHLLILLTGSELVALIDRENGLKDYVANIKAHVDSAWKITLVVEGLERFFRAKDSREHRAFMAQVTASSSSSSAAKRPKRGAQARKAGGGGGGGGGGGDAATAGAAVSSRPAVTRVVAEHVLVWLQMDAEVYPRLTNTAHETAELMFMMTKAVATSIDKRPLEGFSFYPHVERCAKVDSKTFDGLHDLWVKQLKCFPGVSLEMAHAIAQRFRSPHALCEALCTQGLEAVSEIVPRGRSQRLGRAIAAKLLKFFTVTDPNQPLS